eukprot:4979689-Pleurochrysis_carterae.AAC.8
MGAYAQALEQAFTCSTALCSKEVLSRPAGTDAGSPTCGARISWLQSIAGGWLEEEDACWQIAGIEYPEVCGSCVPGGHPSLPQRPPPLPPSPPSTPPIACSDWGGLPIDPAPMQCGLFWFLHISTTGGSTVGNKASRQKIDTRWRVGRRMSVQAGRHAGIACETRSALDAAPRRVGARTPVQVRHGRKSGRGQVGLH